MTDPRELSSAARRLPDWAVADMAAAARICSPELNPAAFLARRPVVSSAPTYRTEAGRVFLSVLNQLPGELDTLFIVPWLTRGGSDLGTLHYARACVEEFGQRVAVIATEAQPSPWASRLPAGVPFVEAGAELASLDALRGEQVAVLCRLILQIRPKRIHIVNSRLGWQAVQLHGPALRGFCRIYASLFCDERDLAGFATGLAIDYLRDCAPHLDAVVTDNALTPREWTRMLGVDPGLFRVVRFPVEQAMRLHESRGPESSNRPRLLWASRVDRQKRPDLLLRIAQRLPWLDIDVHGMTPAVQRTPIGAALARQANLKIHGPFKHLKEIVEARHLAFLYTSDWDGLPIVLLDAAALGLPIIAPRVGGIPDFLDSAELIDVSRDPVALYARRIEEVMKDGELAKALVDGQYAALERHTWRKFVQALCDIPNYTSAL